jgi:NAD(P)-dependent dehydrogenase (short-subunit alcohol dehydrogenase family)
MAQCPRVLDPIFSRFSIKSKSKIPEVYTLATEHLRPHVIPAISKGNRHIPGPIYDQNKIHPPNSQQPSLPQTNPATNKPYTMDSVKGKVYAVTGLGGIGLAVARQLHSQGALLSLADLSEKVLSTARQTIEVEFGSATASTITTTVLDISNVSAVQDWIADTVSHFGRLDGAANMAGTIGKKHGTGKFVDQDDAEWDMLMRVNVTGLMYCLRAQLRAIMETAPGGKGSIVNASSIQGIKGFALHAAYSTTKHAVSGLTKSVSKEVGPEIRVNAVAP